LKKYCDEYKNSELKRAAYNHDDTLASIKCPICETSISENILETVDKDRTSKLIYRKIKQDSAVTHVSKDKK